MSREGLAAIDQNRWDEAEEMFTEALQLSRRDDRAYWGYSEVLWHKGQFDEAIVHLEQAVRLSAGAPELRIRLGNMYLQQGRVDDAAIQASKVLESTRVIATAWALQGDILVHRDQLDDALAAYHRAVSLDRQCPKVRLAVADIYAKQNRHDRVLATVDRLEEDVASSDRQAQIAMMRGIALRELGQTAAGCEHIRSAIAMGKNDPQAYYELAATEFKLQRYPQADFAIANALKQSPDDDACIRLSQNIQLARERLAAQRLFGDEVR